MSKVVDWSKTFKPVVGDIKRGVNNRNTAGSMKEAFAKGHEMLVEQQRAEETLRKAMPLMHRILTARLVNRQPLKVMRPLPYTTEILGGEEEDDGFYSNMSKGEKIPQFKSVTKVIQPGTELTFIALEKSLNQLWFKTNTGEEVGIHLDEQKVLLTQTDIYEVVSKALNEEE